MTFFLNGTQVINSSTLKLGVINSNSSMMNILANNFILSFSILILGYFTLGLYTLFITFYNALVLGLYVKLALIMGYSTKVISLYLLHMPLEIITFSMLGGISFVGWDSLIYYKNYKKMNFNELLKIIPLIIICLFILFISGLLEYYTIIGK